MYPIHKVRINLGIQGVQTLSDKSNLLSLPIQSWSIYDTLDSNWPRDVHNLHIGFEIEKGTLIPA